ALIEGHPPNRQKTLFLLSVLWWEACEQEPSILLPQIELAAAPSGPLAPVGVAIGTHAGPNAGGSNASVNHVFLFRKRTAAQVTIVRRVYEEFSNLKSAFYICRLVQNPVCAFSFL